MVDAPIDIDIDYENLLSWLEAFDSNIKENLCVYSAGRGLFVNRDVSLKRPVIDCKQPNSPLFSVPSAAYVNPLTLSKIYGSDAESTLSANQLISLHLYFYRPTLEKGFKPDPTYGPYLAMLPPDFTSHPLSWLVLKTNKNLLDHLPPSVRINIHKVASRFQKDWEAVSRYIDSLLQEHSTVIPSSYILWSQTADRGTKIERYLWAWLSVNTRSLYLQLYPSRTDPNNVTLCPLVDIANHSSLRQATDRTPFPTFYSPSQTTLQAGDQIYLKYGSHSNSILFTEYGFIEKGCPNGGQVDIQDVIEDQFKILGDLGDWMKSLLESFNFWGDWIMYDSPPPASPSYRLLPPLRLLKLSDTLSHDIIKTSDPFSSSVDLYTWRATIYGEQDMVSVSNEDAVWHHLSSICDSVKARAEKGLETLRTLELNGVLPGWHAYAVECIEQLWLEELHVAEAVAQNIKSGETGHGTL